MAAKKKIAQDSDKSPFQVPCLSCGLCCSYVAVEIEGPSTVKAATEILWHLYHEHISVYRDADDEWLLQFETRCRHINADNQCGIYEARPHICRTFDETSCEVNADDEGTSFYDAQQYLDYLKLHRKVIYRGVAKGHLPPPQSLVGPPADRSKMRPIQQRLVEQRRLRMLV